jgi:hypothetical protein
MEIGTKPIPISVLTAVTNSALNAASVFPSRRIEISDFPYRFEPVGRYSNIQVMDAALQDFGVSRSCTGRRPRTSIVSLSELINERGRSLIQIIERMPLTMIINPSHQYFSVFSSRHVTLRLSTVLIEGGYKP